MKPTRQAGFTLLETLVALAVLGLVALALAGLLRLGGRTWEAGNRDVGASERMHAVEDLLRRAVTEALPLPLAKGGIAFAGGSGWLALVTPMPGHLSLGAYSLLRIEVAETEGRRDLVARWDRFDPARSGLDPGPAARRVTLVDNIDGAAFAYFGKPSGGAVPEWAPGWQGRQAMPALIRLRLRAGGRPWPELVARPMVDQAGGPAPGGS